MFCRVCGREAVELDAKFRSASGVLLPNRPSARGPSSNAGASTSSSWSTRPGESKNRHLTFNEFHKRKEGNRREHFKQNTKRKREEEQLTTINIGVKKYIDGCLKIMRGRLLPVQVPKMAMHESI